ncbi:Ig-like domain-containing protein [Bacteroidota bacterium]
MRIFILNLIVCFFLHFGFVKAQSFSDNPIPFSTNSKQLTIWDGKQYLPFFLKGINLGIAVPGTYPGELAATRDQYGRWFQQIKDAGFNSLRLYTLHYPRFYEVLDSFNIANPHNPLFFFQGVWLNEELDGYSNDLFFLTDTVKAEIRENIDCVHGNRVISHRFGKAYGNYNVDVSLWNIAYIVGREIYPEEILTTDDLNYGINSYQGNHFAIQNSTPSAVWLTSLLDHLVDYENVNYSSQRPVSISNWPTLDPLIHSEEAFRMEDTVSFDLSRIELINAPAGFFFSYHVYPYYPDFISRQSSYQTYYDDYGPNPYLGYLTELKSSCQNYPLIVAEYGVPSSWGAAHYSISGMNQGGFDQRSQGETNIRLLQTIRDAECGGGMQFSWIDEWFKRTWFTDHIDSHVDRRILWHNISAAEQNYGLIEYRNNTEFQNLQSFSADADIQEIIGGVNYAFLEMEIGIKNPLEVPDELWVVLDTYLENVGESILPTGDTLPYRSEFALHITNYSATLYVTEAYDLFGIYHNISGPNQIYQSTITDGAPWKIVRWKNNADHSDVQYIGNLQVNNGFQLNSSKDAVSIYEDKIRIKIPWSLINVTDPSQMRVFHDDRNTPENEDIVSDGFAISVKYKDKFYSSSSRYIWENWNNVNNANLVEDFKTSYFVMQDRLHEFNNEAIAVLDSFNFIGNNYPVNVSKMDGVLKNDFDFDGDIMLALLTELPSNGQLNLNNDGSFTYEPNTGFNGNDSFQYCIYDGYSLSEQNRVVLSINNNTSIHENLLNSDDKLINIHPNPASDFIKIISDFNISELIIFDMSGKRLNSYSVNNSQTELNISMYPPGYYYLFANVKNKMITRKIMISR